MLQYAIRKLVSGIPLVLGVTLLTPLVDDGGVGAMGDPRNIPPEQPCQNCGAGGTSSN